jgi:cytochrome c biogenesis protein
VSILIILIGAVAGSPGFARKILNNPSFAFKGSVMIPETRQSSVIYPFKGGEPIDLGFSVHCDYFTIEYYDNGMPKTYLSRVSVIENGEIILTRDIEVNTPLKHKGITFYQSSYQPYQDFVVSLENKKENKSTKIIVPPRQQHEWQEAGISFGIINRESRGEVTNRVKFWFDDERAEPSVFWVGMGQDAIIERPDATYQLAVKQLYATGLQVTKDPGVFLVYSGCILMMIGLYIAFFMSHQKIFVFLPGNRSTEPVIVAGSTNKNKQGFEKKFTAFADSFKQ